MGAWVRTLSLTLLASLCLLRAEAEGHHTNNFSPQQAAAAAFHLKVGMRWQTVVAVMSSNGFQGELGWGSLGYTSVIYTLTNGACLCLDLDPTDTWSAELHHTNSTRPYNLLREARLFTKGGKVGGEVLALTPPERPPPVQLYIVLGALGFLVLVGLLVAKHLRATGVKHA